jgi:hypothetical protein
MLQRVVRNRAGGFLKGVLRFIAADNVIFVVVTQAPDGGPRQIPRCLPPLRRTEKVAVQSPDLRSRQRLEAVERLGMGIAIRKNAGVRY